MSTFEIEQSAFVLRIAPSEIDAMDEALETDEIIIGWANAKGLLNSHLDWQRFREIIHRTYYEGDDHYKRSGNASGHMWRFIRNMKEGDLVVVPHTSGFFVAQVKGEPRYDEARVSDDRAYRRPVTWLNSGKAIPRNHAKAALMSRMKNYGTCALATDLIAEIHEVLRISQLGKKPHFGAELREKLIRQTLKEIRQGRIENYGFERLVASVLEGLGAQETVIVPRSRDKGGDIIARFLVAGAFEITLAVQVKHHFRAEYPMNIEPVNEVAQGMLAEGAHLGLVVTAGTISKEAYDHARKLYEERQLRIDLVDGEQLASLIVDYALIGTLNSELYAGN